MEAENPNPVTTQPVLSDTNQVSGDTSEPRNVLATFLLTIVGGYIGLRHFYLGNNVLGWIRTGLFVGGYLWIIILSLLEHAVLAGLGIFAILVAVVWAIVDFFYVYFTVKNDAEGKPLTATRRDKKWIKVFFWSTVVATGLAFMLGLIAAARAEEYMDTLPTRPTTNFPSNSFPTTDEGVRLQ